MYEYDSRVRVTEVSQNQRMTLNAILDLFQNASVFHSEDLGVGMRYLQEQNRMWVLTSWKIVVKRYPELAEHIKVGTWPYEFGKITGERNFRLLDRDGQMAAYADSSWVLMDTARLRPARLDENIIAAYQLDPPLDMEYEKGKIKIPDNLEEKEAFVIHAHHLDVNHHVNNGQYVLFAGDYLPEEYVIHQMRAEYKKQAVLNDMIYPQVGYDEGVYTVLLCDEAGRAYAVIEFK